MQCNVHYMCILYAHLCSFMQSDLSVHCLHTSFYLETGHRIFGEQNFRTITVSVIS